MATKSQDERIHRLEQIVHVLAEDQVHLQKQMAKDYRATQKQIAELASTTRQMFDQVARRIAETDRQMRKTDERFKQTDERIEKLVIAIGQFIQKN